MNWTNFEKLFRVMALIGVVVGGAGMVAACDKDGPLEEAGESIDNAADEIADEIDQAF
jgi:hypothetical protein